MNAGTDQHIDQARLRPHLRNRLRLVTTKTCDQCRRPSPTGRCLCRTDRRDA